MVTSVLSKRTKAKRGFVARSKWLVNLRDNLNPIISHLTPVLLVPHGGAGGSLRGSATLGRTVGCCSLRWPCPLTSSSGCVAACTASKEAVLGQVSGLPA